MNTEKIYDIIGIGIGPFNLGMAALAAEVPNFDCIFIEKNPAFKWHPGMMLPTAKMQVPFYADLVTLANPRSQFTYLNYLKSVGRLFKFAINESYIPYRHEFQAYCEWVISQLSTLHFGWECTAIKYQKRNKLYTISIHNNKGETKELNGKHIVIGIGSEPSFPACADKIKHPSIFHSSDYATRKSVALMHKRITIIGSGQSAAEIFYDLLQHHDNDRSLHWYTRSERFHPMEYSKLTLEMSSPEYIHHFYSLDSVTKKKVLSQQDYLYKGINEELIKNIYDQLYLLDLLHSGEQPKLFTNYELNKTIINGPNKITLQLQNRETHQSIFHNTDAVILATGYKQRFPSFLSGIKRQINWLNDGSFDIQQNYSIDNRNNIFIQNAERHTHGFNSADLGLGPYRNAVILNSVLKKEYFAIERSGNTFQHFGTKSA